MIVRRTVRHKKRTVIIGMTFGKDERITETVRIITWWFLFIPVFRYTTVVRAD